MSTPPVLELRVAITAQDFEKQARTIDTLEVGHRVSGQIRFAIQVPDVKAAAERLIANGATLVHPLVVTPWGDQNVRFQDPEGLQVTLYQKSGQT